MGDLKIKFPVTGISETWLDDCYHSSDNEHYTFVHNYREGRKGGGVGFYLDNTNFKQRDDLAFSDNNAAESLFTELNFIQQKKKILFLVLFIDCPIKK